MSGPGETERESTSPLERETGERDVHPEEEGRSRPDTSDEPTKEAMRERQESEEKPR
ncbi:hypothetical protein [Streptomyces glaucus]|uniref:Uncharacterized protein n=1 Tax=Streptomyces glaucus TaxID=284029 RepID=A0ABP5XLV3_9ACTN